MRARLQVLRSWLQRRRTTRARLDLIDRRVAAIFDIMRELNAEMGCTSERLAAQDEAWSVWRQVKSPAAPPGPGLRLVR